MLEIGSLEEAYECYYETSSTQKREFILKEWNRLYLTLFQDVIEGSEPEQFFHILSEKQLPPEGEARDIINAAAKRFASMISSPEQAKKCYDFFPGRVQHLAVEIVKRWEELSLAETDKANSVSEIEIVANQALYNGDAFAKAMLKWASLCTTVDEIKHLSIFVGKKDTYSRVRSEIERAVQSRRISILIAETPKVKDTNTIIDYYNFTPKESAVEIFVYEKWLDLCTTPEEANEAFIRAPANNKVFYQLKAYERMKNLAMAQ